MEKYNKYIQTKKAKGYDVNKMLSSAIYNYLKDLDKQTG